MIDRTLPSRMRGRDKILYNVMKDGNWYTLDDINRLTGYPSASASAGIRDFRKSKYGNNTVLAEHIGGGVYRYKLILNTTNNIIEEKLGENERDNSR